MIRMARMGQEGQPLAEKTNGTGLRGTERDVVVREAANYGSEGWGFEFSRAC
ncbi:MAG: hypothetical protein QNJ89_13435 [Acidimicrobiia bacterium]|nr:hypothetical protein [Acidimicrobiia bacterium]